MKQSVLICFIGIDGSGKTTLAKGLIADLKKNEIGVEYKWGKFKSSLLEFVIFIKNSLLVREKNWKKNYEKSLKVKKNIFGNVLISKLYEYFVLIDYTFQIIFKITIPLKLRKNIVCDRYVYDTIVDLALDLEYSDEKMECRLNQLFKLLPAPNIVFFMDVPEDIAFKRKEDVPSLEFLTIKKEMYLKILRLLKDMDDDKTIVYETNGTEPIANLKKEVLKVVTEIIER